MKFSIICPTYKRINLLEESLYSVLNQSFKNYELIIINDNPLQKIYFNHPQVRIINLDNKFKSIGQKRNFGTENSRGDLIIQLDDDDFFLPDYLGNIAEAIKDCDLLSIQKPILYFDNKRIILPPRPFTNTFVYKRATIGNLFKYEHINFDELTPFYHKAITSYIGKSRFMQLKSNQNGYVYRQLPNDKRKYSLVRIGGKSLEEQDRMLCDINDYVGNIQLFPKWAYNYTDIIKNNIIEEKNEINPEYDNIIEGLIKR